MLRERSYSNGRKGGEKYLGNIDTNLDDFSRYIVDWKPCPTMKAHDVCDTLDLALAKRR
jgi:transposase InsO family protein